MRISPRYTSDDWTKLTFSTEDDWKKAIDIFLDRIKGRFLDIVDDLVEYEYAGFAILALDCLLIETLQQFREGVDDTPRNKGREYFVNFLTGTCFGEHFDEEKATKFYEQVRCGILHKAEVKGSSRVLKRRGVPLVKYAEGKDGLVINRDLFHNQLKKAVEDYIRELQNPSNEALRSNFREKMNHISKASSEAI